MNLFLDIVTGKFRNALNAADLPAVRFFANDIATLGITLVSGKTIVTTAQLSGGKKLRCALRGFPLTDAPLIEAELSTIVDEVASASIDLENETIAAYFAARVPASAISWECVFEVQIEASDASTRSTITQARSLVGRDLVTVGTVTAVLLADNDGTVLADNDGTLNSDNPST